MKVCKWIKMYMYLSCCRLHTGRVKYYKHMWLQAGNETTRRRLSVYQHRQRPDCQSKITWNQVCVLSRHKLWQFFFGKTLSTTDIVPTCCYEKDLQFPREIWAAKVYTSGKNVIDLFFSAVSRVEIKNLQRWEQTHFLVSQLCHSISFLQFPEWK